jgi:dTDP-4-dehydrorhamnose 3,5-epimerase
MMRFEPLVIQGAARVCIDAHTDERGWFARIFCEREFGEQARPFDLVQASLSFNARAGTVRGLHFQWPPTREGKLVRCVRGRLVDVMLDLRPESASYLQHLSLPLDAESGDALYLPSGVAHGFQTLADATEILYMMDDYYAPALQAGLRWNDPAFGIRWPLTQIILSERDRALPLFERSGFERELQRRRAMPPAGTP